MFGSEILDVAVGIIFVFILVSVICSAIREGIEAFVKTRSAHLEHAIRELLQDRNGVGLAKSLYEHPFIYGLFHGEYKPSGGKTPSMWTLGGELPSYIPARSFAMTLMDIAARGPVTDAVSGDPESPPVSIESMRRNILNLQNPPVQRILLAALDSAEGNLDKVRENIEAWFNSAMDRISGRYKRSTHRTLFVIGLLLAILMNINTITIAEYLYRNDAVRAAIVAKASAAAGNTDMTYETAKKDLNDLSLPIGWDLKWEEMGTDRVTLDDVTRNSLGWLLTALAATLGAPFWFDVLNKVMVIRSTVKPHEKSPEEASEDRQPKTEKPATVPAAPDTSQTQAGGAGSSAAPAPPPRTGQAESPPIQSPLDQHSRVDTCDVDFAQEEETPDDQLPPAEGGVA
jgi:hypothetical protein